MIDLNQLEDERQEAEMDKAELFEFYHDNWGKVISELTAARDRLHAIELYQELKHADHLCESDE
jgi:hypothetical protein